MPAMATGLRVALEATLRDWVGLATRAFLEDMIMEFMVEACLSFLVLVRLGRQVLALTGSPSTILVKKIRCSKNSATAS